MKNFTIRAFVLSLVLAGAAATTVSNAATPAKKAVVATDPTGPAPLCMPNSGDHCGMD